MSKKIAADPVKLKRAYESAALGDGKRILFDRLWPREVKKADAAIDLWLKDIASSTALRKWVGYDRACWERSHSRYAAKVREYREQLDPLRARARQGPITLECSAHGEVHTDVVALWMLLPGRRTKLGVRADHRKRR